MLFSAVGHVRIVVWRALVGIDGLVTYVTPGDPPNMGMPQQSRDRSRPPLESPPGVKTPPNHSFPRPNLTRRASLGNPQHDTRPPPAAPFSY